jgi:hypothetical protein
MADNMTIVQWFDPENIQHIKAYKHLMVTGVWPEGFIPRGIEFPPTWQIELIGKMANLWIDSVIRGESGETKEEYTDRMKVEYKEERLHPFTGIQK